MCLVALLHRMVDDAPIIVGANREEFYKRGGQHPQILEGQYSFLAGRDPVAGGTWLGVNQHGVLIAVTNRRKENLPREPRSRGLLACDLLQCASAKDALDLAIDELDHKPYAGCNFLLADAERVTVIHAGDWLQIRPLPPGIHILTATDVNDTADARLSYALHWLAEAKATTSRDALNVLRELCAHTGNGTPPICLKGKDRGTVSSSVIALSNNNTRSQYWHAPGSPDVTAYEDYSEMLGELLRM